jgi:hypothetical protein
LSAAINKSVAIPQTSPCPKTDAGGVVIAIFKSNAAVSATSPEENQRRNGLTFISASIVSVICALPSAVHCCTPFLTVQNARCII